MGKKGGEADKIYVSIKEYEQMMDIFKYIPPFDLDVKAFKSEMKAKIKKEFYEQLMKEVEHEEKNS